MRLGFTPRDTRVLGQTCGKSWAWRSWRVLLVACGIKGSGSSTTSAAPATVGGTAAPVTRATTLPTTAAVTTAPTIGVAPTTPAPSLPVATTAAAPAAPASSCHPLTNGGNCYEPGEFCRATDHGVSGVAGDGKTIVCENKDGWRWEPV